jgi:hypothetical protein
MNKQQSTKSVIKTPTEKDLLKMIKPEIITMIKQSIDNKIPAYDLMKITKDPGHYIIMSNKPVPEIACKNDNFRIGDLYCWYNGTSTVGLRKRIKSHLHRKDINAQLNSSSGIAVEVISEELIIKEWKRKGKNYKEARGYYKKAKGDGSLRFLNGIQNNYDADFYVALIPGSLIASPIELIFRQEFGTPPLCQYHKR